MKNVPTIIYLNIGDDPEEKFEDFKQACEVLGENLTWCEDPIDCHTIRYQLPDSEWQLITDTPPDLPKCRVMLNRSVPIITANCYNKSVNLDACYNFKTNEFEVCNPFMNTYFYLPVTHYRLMIEAPTINEHGTKEER